MTKKKYYDEYGNQIRSRPLKPLKILKELMLSFQESLINPLCIYLFSTSAVSAMFLHSLYHVSKLFIFEVIE